MAMLSASVPPEVKNISDGDTFKSLATFFRAYSIAALVFRPNECIDEGLPKCSVINGSISFKTSLSKGVVAALSK